MAASSTQAPIAESRAEERREGLLLGTVAASPLFPHAIHLARDGASRFAVKGDFAVLELTTRLAASGDVLLGPYSRYKFAHPGPLYFYVLAPIYRAMGGSSAAIPFGACLIGIAAAYAAVHGARLLGRAPAFAALACVLAWLAAFGNVCATAWNPMVVVLPLLAYAILAVAFARGSTAAAIPAVFFGALAAETHLACVPSVGGIGAVAIVGHVLARRRGEVPAERAGWRPLAVATSLLTLFLAPPVLEQVRGGASGNVAKLARAFIAREEPMKSVSRAIRNLFLAAHWLPERLGDRTLREEGLIPRVMGWDPVPDEASASVVCFAIVHVLAVVIAVVVARRRRDGASLGLLAMGLFAEGLAVMSLRSSLGIDYRYLVFWTSAATTLAWIGVASTFTSAAAESLFPRELVESVSPARVSSFVLLLAIPAALAVGDLQRTWIGHNQPAPRKRPGVEAIYRALRAELAARGAEPVVHLDGAWELCTAFQLELARDGVRAYVHEDERWVLGPKAPLFRSAPKPLHVWAGLPAERPRIAACKAPVAEAPAYDDYPPIALWVAEGDPPESCAPSP